MVTPSIRSVMVGSLLLSGPTPAAGSRFAAGHPIRIRPSVTAVVCRDGRWQAVRHLQESGETPALDLSE
ncbi:hypothetical protein [Paracoccus denitrificans]|uniref:hypothetical protein n=1 Tax=Paracoccus denitrificans TaxID=266 RepID=UPI00117450E3|nr:hypothetical protein [Paracoccus denitrificans]MBB4625831.1 hypothetical protein [Paracoccus denitrificans]MCU7427005.1 hypothetical protein [Paracoccus denitrificans]UPV96969.1 hypothetical protein M0K93_21410 [Paracoccus denitrificans]WQO36499.1 hypothetical protein U0005_18705 [Paracoccus denitrificans]GEK68287.1 hypothetical protein PDE01_18070 [Paracoccus denitrificans]